MLQANNIIGAGLLSLPWCFKEATVAPGVVALLFTGLLNCMSVLVLARCCDLAGDFSFFGIAAAALGKRAALVVQATVGLYAAGSCITYVVLIGDLIPEVFHDLHSHLWLVHRTGAIIVAAAAIIFPLSLNTRLAALRFTSALGL